MERIALVLLLLLPLTALAQRSVKAEDCFNNGGHADARGCLVSRAIRSAKELGRAEERVLAALKRWDQENAYRNRSAAIFKQANAAFARMRRAQCDWQASLAAGGNSADDRRLSCAIELNNRRTADLVLAISDLP